MGTRATGCVAVMAALALNACSKPTTADQVFLDRAEQIYVLVATAQFDAVLAQFAPSVPQQAYRDELIRMRALIPEGAAGPPVLVEWSSDMGGVSKGKTVVFRYDYPDRAALAKVRFAGSGGDSWRLYGFQVLPAGPESPRVIARGRVAPPPVVRTEPAGS